MSLEHDLDRAITTATAMAIEGEQLKRSCRPSLTRQTVYLSAFERGAERTYVVFDNSGTVISDRRMVGDTVTVIALAERAEEVSAATAAEDLQLAFSDLATALGPLDHEAATAAAAVAVAAAETAAAAAGPRAASPAYLDRIAHVASRPRRDSRRVRAARRAAGRRGCHRSGHGGAGSGGLAGDGAGRPLGRSRRLRPGHDRGHRAPWTRWWTRWSITTVSV